MIIMCQSCGIEYSYGRNICHTCGDNTLFFGAIFKEPRKTYQWNCDTTFNCIDLQLKEHESYKAPLEIMPEEKL